MSKKSKKAPQTRRPAAARQASAKSRARTAKTAPRLNLRSLRIAAGALGVLSLAGFVSLILTKRASISAGVVVELVLLALVAGVCIFTIIRPDLTARWFFQPKK